MRVQQLAEPGRLRTRDLAGPAQLAHTSLSFLVLCGRVPLGEEGRDLESWRGFSRADPGLGLRPGDQRRGQVDCQQVGAGGGGGGGAQSLI